MTLRPTLISPAPAEYTTLTLLTRCPTLTEASRLPLTPDPAWHREDVSDSQDVRSQAVDPNLVENVSPASPSPDPCKVTLADPEDPLFSLVNTLTIATSIDMDTLMLPTRDAALIKTRRLPITPDPAWHRIDVSDSHTDRSQPVWPRRIDPVYGERPNASPCRDILADPEEPAFPRLVTLAAATSKESKVDALPTRRPTLKLKSRLPAAPDPTLHVTDVSDTHALCSHVVRPDRADALYDAWPTPDPYTITLTEPLESTFPCRNALKLPKSTDNSPETLRTRAATLTDASKVPNTPEPAWHLTEVSDPHVVTTQAVRDTLADPLYVARPMLAPCRVTLADPVAA